MRLLFVLQVFLLHANIVIVAAYVNAKVGIVIAIVVGIGFSEALDFDNDPDSDCYFKIRA
jgi:hypothetical protein